MPQKKKPRPKPSPAPRVARPGQPKPGQREPAQSKPAQSKPGKRAQPKPFQGNVSRSETATPSELIARTIGDAARHFGISVRRFAAWCVEPGFPGTPGSPGKADGCFPIEEIRRWHLAMHRGRERDEDDAELLEARKLQELNKADQSQVDLEKELATICDADEVAGFCRRVVAATKAQLEEIADRTLVRLPSKITAADRKTIRKAIEQSVVEALNTIAELVAGDSDDAEDLPDEPDEDLEA